MAYLAISFVFAIMAIQELLVHVKKEKGDENTSAAYAAATGFILQAISMFFWMLLLGTLSAAETKEKREVSQVDITLPSQISHAISRLSIKPIDTSIELPFSEILVDDLSPQEYRYQARAIYSYETDDTTELAFKRDEILEVAETKGRWWSARHPNGLTGIVPSNYLELINT
ncbi:Transmembrane osmosensor [Entomophthora muscae]|uniref:Transmembrane osmosensor n=1 Tax=Entomophthora muscae TaxID=34485 RepID=A0ACC2SKJ0_9FUNG|nr:Transmembrane osmosensor [Entomophthora muscae]